MNPNFSYRNILLRAFNERRERNPRYSLRAFARDLEIVPSRLSEIMKQKSGLSVEVANRIAGKIGLSEEETVLFGYLVDSEHSRSLAGKQLAKSKVETILASRVHKMEHLDAYKTLLLHLGEDRRFFDRLLSSQSEEEKAALEVILMDAIRSWDNRLQSQKKYSKESLQVVCLLIGNAFLSSVLHDEELLSRSENGIQSFLSDRKGR